MKRKKEEHNHTKRQTETLGKTVPDQYYTCRTIVKDLVNDIVRVCGNVECYIDSSAGDGYVGFVLKQQMETLRKVLMYDTHPNALSVELGSDLKVEKQDWFKVYTVPNVTSVIVGFNPPFGYCGSEAKKFVEHALSLTKDIPKVYIAMILPHIQNRVKMMNRWLPEGCVELFIRDIPDADSFYRLSDLEFPVIHNVKFIIYERNPDAHQEEVERRDSEHEALMAKCPRDFVVSCIRNGDRRNRIGIMPQFEGSSHVVLLRVNLMAFLMMWEGGVVRFNVNGTMRGINDDEDISWLQWKYIRFPTRYSEEEIREAMFDIIIPIAKNSMAERGAYWKVSQPDIWKGIVELVN